MVFWVEDTDAFPSLCEAHGWQVAGRREDELNVDGDLGGAWCDRAKGIASMPTPRPATKPAAAVTAQKKCVNRHMEASDLDTTHPETDYECRHRLGKERAHKRAQFGRSTKVSAGSDGHSGGALNREEMDGACGEGSE